MIGEEQGEGDVVIRKKHMIEVIVKDCGRSCSFIV